MQIQFKEARSIIFSFAILDLEIAIPVSYLRDLRRKNDRNSWSYNWMAINDNGHIHMFRVKPKFENGRWFAYTLAGAREECSYLGSVEVPEDWDPDMTLVRIDKSMRDEVLK